MKNLKIYFAIILVIFLIAFFGYVYSQNSFSLDVIQVIDENFEYLNEEQIKAVSAKASRIMKEKFESDIKFKYVKKIAYGNFQAQYSNINSINEFNKYKINIFDLENDENLIPYTYYNYQEKYEIEELKKFINNEYTLKPSNNYKSIIGLLLAMHRQKIEQIRNVTLPDKTLLLKKEKFKKNSLVNWADMVKNCKYDLIITNSLLIDDFYDMPPHSLIRGGVLFGFTQKNNARYGATAVASIFPIITQMDYFVKERGFSESEEELDMIAYSIIHELFHALFKYKDDYTLNKCPINPVRGLHIKEWYENLKTRKKFDIP